MCHLWTGEAAVSLPGSTGCSLDRTSTGTGQDLLGERHLRAARCGWERSAWCCWSIKYWADKAGGSQRTSSHPIGRRGLSPPGRKVKGPVNCRVHGGNTVKFLSSVSHSGGLVEGDLGRGKAEAKETQK